MATTSACRAWWHTSTSNPNPDPDPNPNPNPNPNQVAHEYFHNWSGNRVTCRDWFQLTLKEGFTVYRDQVIACPYP